ncbi:MAG TPA: hypothetical protein VM577_02945 [Anaerovoracaceae bacterium]|nr:hypothetical protein [Anaerovoracaceae bacterium]
MITAYLTAISTIYEGEDIEIRYSIYEDQELLQKDSVLMEYKKPAIVGQVALLTLLKKLKAYPDKEISIIINDPALYEFVKGTSTTKNKDVLIHGREIRKELNKHGNVKVKDIQGDRTLLAKWNEALSFTNQGLRR